MSIGKVWIHTIFIIGFYEGIVKKLPLSSITILCSVSHIVHTVVGIDHKKNPNLSSGLDSIIPCELQSLFARVSDFRCVKELLSLGSFVL